MRKLSNVSRVTSAIAVLLLAGFVLVQETWAQQSAEELYEIAILKKETEGDLEGAVKLFREILASYPDNRSVAAKAQLQIGLCHEKLGIEEASKAYQLVLKNYGDQEEPVSIARARLAELQVKTPSGPSVSHIPFAENELYMESPTLSPDGTKLLAIHISTPHGQNVVYKDVATGKIEFITKFKWEGEGQGWTSDAVWAPDSKRVAFRFDGREEPLQELRIADLKGNSRTIYKCKTKTEEIYPEDWFPDDQSLLAIQMLDKKLIKLVRVPLEGGELDVIYELVPPKGIMLRANADNVIMSDLSPDGKHIVFHVHKNSTKNIYIMSVSERKATVLMDSPAENRTPFWSPDGKYVAFMSDRSGNSALWALPINEQGQATGPPFVLSQMDFGRIGSWSEIGIYYRAWITMHDIYTMPVDPKTGEPAGTPQPLDFSPMGRNVCPMWSPDGRYLAFISGSKGASDELSIVIYPLSSGDVLKFSGPIMARQIHPAMSDLHWLSDSSGMGFTATFTNDAAEDDQYGIKRKLHILNIETGKWISPDVELMRRSNFAVWNKEKRGFYFARSSVDTKKPVIPEILEYNIITGEERTLYRPDREKVLFPSMRISRDYSKLAVTDFRDETLLVLDTKSGTLLKRVEEFWGYPSPPAWSPDGDHLMTMTGKEGDKLLVYSLLDGTRNVYDVQTEALSRGGMRSVDWSLDGTKIAFTWLSGRADDCILHNPIPKTEKRD